MEAFEFPKIHSFPPLYTKQPNATIGTHQLDSWCQIILDYCEHYKVTSLTQQGGVRYSQLAESIDELPSLFSNKEINRTVNDDFKSLIFNHLINKLKKAEYINIKQPELGIYVYWRSLTEWSQLLHDFIDKTGQLGTILTIYELTNGLDGTGLPESLNNIEEALLVKVIKEVLVKQGKAQLLINEDNEIGGVKIV